MIRNIIFVCVALLTLSKLTAQGPEQRTLGTFNKLIAGDKLIVRLVKADHESASIQAQGIDASSVRTTITGNTLELSIYGEPFTKKKIIITLHYVHLNSITVTGGADVTTTSLFKADSLQVDLKSGGMLYLDADLEYLGGKIVEGAILSAKGYATEQNMVVSSTATLSAYELESEVITIKASTGGKAKINVEKELHAEASSHSFISYKGNPASIQREVKSGGTISPYSP